MIPLPPSSTLFPYSTLFRSGMVYRLPDCKLSARELAERLDGEESAETVLFCEDDKAVARREGEELRFAPEGGGWRTRDRKSTRLNSSHLGSSYAVFCSRKKT